METNTPTALDHDVGSGPIADDEFGSSVRRGLRWSLSSQLAVRAASMLSGIVLVRLLGSEQFGVYVYGLAISAIALSVNDLGQVLSIVRWPDENYRRAARTATTLVWTNTVVIYLTAFLLAGPIASRTEDPALTAGVIRLMCMIVLFDGLTAAPRALLVRSFAQNRLATADLLGIPVMAVVSIVLAVNGFGAWAPALAMIMSTVVTASIVLYYAPVFPKPGLDRGIARDLLRFGLPLAGTTFIELLLLNVDYLIIGSTMSIALLGFYGVAFNISSWPSTVITQAVRRVSVAGFSRMVDDPERLNHGFSRAFNLLALTTLLMTALLSGMASPLVEFVYGVEQLPAAAVLTWLALIGSLRVAIGLVFDLLIGLGRSRTTFLLQLLWLLTVTPAIWFGARVDGIRGVSIAHVAVAVLVAAPGFAWGLRSAGIDVKALARGLVRPVLGAVAAFAVAVALRDRFALPFVALAVVSPIMCVVYVLIALSPSDLKKWARLEPLRGPR